jgi:hypothetical protein
VGIVSRDRRDDVVCDGRYAFEVNGFQPVELRKGVLEGGGANVLTHSHVEMSQVLARPK